MNFGNVIRITDDNENNYSYIVNCDLDKKFSGETVSNKNPIYDIDELRAYIEENPNRLFSGYNLTGTVTKVYHKSAGDLIDHVNDFQNPHNVTKGQLGLGNVDNTSDLDKPVSTLVRAELNNLASNVSSITQRLAVLEAKFVGDVLWYSGLVDNIPEGVLVCNGQAVSREDYSSLFNVIGTKYGVGDGETTFNVPDLRGMTGSSDYGLFIRSGFNDAAIGNREDDQIRNIYGEVVNWNNTAMWTQHGFNKGVFDRHNWQNGKKSWADSTNSYNGGDGIIFSADDNYGDSCNPMKSHAHGIDIHPANIRFLPLIVYNSIVLD